MRSFLLGLAGHTFWSDLGKCPKSATGQIRGAPGPHFGLGTFWAQFVGLKHIVL